MPHIHTGPGQHDFTASAFIFRTDTPKPSLLLHKHKIFDKYMQVGGHVELHEHPWTAVIHEIREESGYDINQLKILQPPGERLTKFSDGSVHPLPIDISTFRFGDKDHFHTDIRFAFVTDQEPRHSIAEGESIDVKFFTEEELKALPNNQTVPNVREAALFAFDHILDKWEPVDPTAYHA